MPRKSPKLKKSEMDMMMKRHRTKLQKVTDSVDDASEQVAAQKEKATAKREEIKTLQGHLADLSDKLSNHPIVQKRDAKRTEVAVAKEDLEQIIDELGKAKELLQRKVQARDDTITAFKQELGGDDDDG